VLVAMTFRTPAEGVALCNNTNYGLAASVWSENINLALDVARGIQAGTVWVNCTNLFDAASGFGGYRESGYGREGGREGLFEYLQPAWEAEQRLAGAASDEVEVSAGRPAERVNGRRRRAAALANETAPAASGNGTHGAPNGDAGEKAAVTLSAWPRIDRTPQL